MEESKKGISLRTDDADDPSKKEGFGIIRPMYLDMLAFPNVGFLSVNDSADVLSSLSLDSFDSGIACVWLTY